MKRKLIVFSIMLLASVALVGAADLAGFKLTTAVAEVPRNYRLIDNVTSLPAADATVVIVGTGMESRTYKVQYNGNVANVIAYTLTASVTDFVNINGAPASVPVTLDIGMTSATSNGLVAATGSSAAIAITAGRVADWTDLGGSGFSLSWPKSNTLPAGTYEATVTVTYTAV